MKRLILTAVLSSLMLALGGCTHSVHMVNTNGFGDVMPKGSTTQYIEARSEQVVVFGFVFDVDYVDEAHTRLLNQCDGNIRAVSTQFSTSHGFLHWTNKILMKGICEQPSA